MIVVLAMCVLAVYAFDLWCVAVLCLCYMVCVVCVRVFDGVCVCVVCCISIVVTCGYAGVVMWGR